MMGAIQGGGVEYVRVVADPKHTRNLFGPLSEIAGKRLRVLDRNQEGDCLCLFEGSKGQNIVDVDHEDILLPNAGHLAAAEPGLK